LARYHSQATDPIKCLAEYQFGPLHRRNVLPAERVLDYARLAQ